MLLRTRFATRRLASTLPRLATSAFHYELPSELIAVEAAEPLPLSVQVALQPAQVAAGSLAAGPAPNVDGTSHVCGLCRPGLQCELRACCTTDCHSHRPSLRCPRPSPMLQRATAHGHCTRGSSAGHRHTTGAAIQLLDRCRLQSNFTARAANAASS